MSPSETSLPFARKLPAEFSVRRAFGVLSKLPHCLWLDSAANCCDSPSRLPEQEDVFAPIGRYSFLTADPVSTLIADVDQPSPWPTLHQWAAKLPSHRDETLPPFQGGIAGVIAYESGAWLESVGVPSNNDFPTPAMSLGLYDWTIAVDHMTGDAWIISQGINDNRGGCSRVAAVERVEQIERLLGECTESTQPRSKTHEGTDNDVPPSVVSNFTSDQFRAAVAEIVQRIRGGDSFQVNLAQRLLHKSNSTPVDLYQKLRVANPAPFGGFYDGGDFAVLSSSPEGFLTVRDRVVQTRPIKGTIHRSEDADEDSRLAQRLRDSEKDRAENIMIVDLMRNDLSRVCADDSVTVEKQCAIETYQYVHHLVSVVQGRLREGQSVVDLLQACFPGGSVTGAPKIEAMRTIAELEPNPRGPYCGSMGYISCGGWADFNILIRTITGSGGDWQIPVGGGITARSVPEEEEAETWAKAKGMLRALRD